MKATARLVLLLLLALPAVLQADSYQAPYYYTTNNGTITITGHTGTNSVAVIPDTINGLPVAGIGDDAFWLCTSLTSVTIPNGVTSIKDRAFAYCTSLTNVAISINVTNIGVSAFFLCTSLTHVMIPHRVTGIKNKAFCRCTSLMGIYFKGDAPSLGASAFDGDKKVTVHYLPGTTGWGKTFGGRPTALWNPEVQGNAAAGVRAK